VNPLQDTIEFIPNIERAVDFHDVYRKQIQDAVTRVRARSVSKLPNQSSLEKILSHSAIYHIPTHVVPRSFKGKQIGSGTVFQLGRSSATIKEELGRGAYGVVVLIDSKSNDGADEGIAVKAQTPMNCLAWEYEVLELVWKRLKPHICYPPFPKPLAFLSLADGGLLSMKAYSDSGLNLVDLVNVYKVKLGEGVPEIISLYYMSRMLHHLEQLHWHGKILVSTHLTNMHTTTTVHGFTLSKSRSH
jgi:hypothetical protein